MTKGKDRQNPSENMCTTSYINCTYKRIILVELIEILLT